MAMRVLVTGSSGLVGSAAVAFFDDLGCDVTGIDNNLRADFFGPDGDTEPTRFRLHQRCRRFRHRDLDIRDRAAVDALLAEGGFGLIVHAAAQPSHDLAARRPFDDFDINAVGTLNLLEACRRHCPAAAFTFLSTNKVYGDGPNRLPMVATPTRFDFADPAHRRGIAEDFPVDQCLHSLFGASKLAADVMVQEYGRYFGMNTGVFRGGCLTGPDHAGVELHGFLNYLVRAALAEAPYTVFGHGGKQVRDQIHADDVVAALWQFAQRPRPGEVYNLGGGPDNAASLLECVQRIERLCGRRPRLRLDGAERRGDHRCYYTDLGKLRAHYPDWRLGRSLDDILAEMVANAAERRAAATVVAVPTAAAEPARPIPRPAPPRVAWIYPAYSPARIAEEDGFCARMNALGHDLRPFGVPCRGWLPFAELDRRFRLRDPDLMQAYQRLGALLADCDVLVAAGGSMVHPDLAEQFRGTTVFVSADDPENSAHLSRPTAPHFDLSLVVNPACLDDYRAWGCRHVEWIFPVLRPDRIAPGVTAESILDQPRPLDIVLCCEREFGLSDRAQRVEALRAAFPQAHVRGPGWPAGPEPQVRLYPRARLGWNLHNSTGPCNTRVLELPANGVFQLCDNPERLHLLFEPGREIVGFGSLAECIQRTRHYLAHEDERRAIAAAAFQRVHRDYTEVRWFERLLAAVARVAQRPQAAASGPGALVAPGPG